MRYLILLAALAGCSHAERSATTPAPRANFLTGAAVEADASAEADRFCKYYHSQPAALVGRTGAMARYECAGRARGDDPTWLERVGHL